MEQRDANACTQEMRTLLQYMRDNQWVDFTLTTDHEQYLKIGLTTKGYLRIETLQHQASGRDVFVAMQFGKDTKRLRDAIRQGIHDAGYFAVFVDEVQHNELITPEMLKHIRDSKFVVVDLSHQNNGAYFEEGYAIGCNKPVIQLCQKDTKLHFDVAQKNTIIWETEEDIPEKLRNRIKATIE